ncbi:unnamed protein product [Calypogeia fissa]
MASPEVVKSSGAMVPGGFSEEPFAIEGWKKKLMLKKGGTPKKKDVVYVAPDGEEIRTKRQLEKYLKNHPGGPSASDFDWSTGETPRRSARLSSKGRLSSDSAEAEPATKRSKLDEDEDEEEDPIVVVSPRKTPRKKAARKDGVTEETGKRQGRGSIAADDSDAKVANDTGAGVDETPLSNNTDGKHVEEGIASAIEEVNPGNSADQVKAEEQALKVDEPLTVTDIAMEEVTAVEAVPEVGEAVIPQQPGATSVELPAVEEFVKPAEGETSLKQDEEVKKEVSQDVLDVPTTEELDGTNDDPLKPKDHIHAFIEQQTEHSLPVAERVGVST